MDYIACLFEIVGAILLGNKNKWGFALLMIGNLFWFMTGCRIGLEGLIVVSAVFLLINVRNFIKWQREKAT